MGGRHENADNYDENKRCTLIFSVIPPLYLFENGTLKVIKHKKTISLEFKLFGLSVLFFGGHFLQCAAQASGAAAVFEERVV